VSNRLNEFNRYFNTDSPTGRNSNHDWDYSNVKLQNRILIFFNELKFLCLAA
jgi:hypothetical protein